MDWQPIETAPKDGTAFMAWAKGYEWPEVVKWFDYDADTAVEVGEPGYLHYAEELLQNVTDSPENLTHWMPLPAPPAA